MTTPFLRRSVTALCGFVALHLLACAWAVAPIITYVELFRIHERGRGQQGESYSVEIQAFAPSGKTITVTTPLGGTHTLIEEDDDGREGGEVEYEYNLRNLPNLNDYPPGNYTFHVYADAGKQTLNETFVAVFPAEGAFAFPAAWASLTTPTPDGYAVTASRNQGYAWSAYTGPQGSASHTLFCIFEPITDVDVVYLLLGMDVTTHQPVSPIPSGAYVIELSFQNVNQIQEGGRGLRFVNERLTNYDLTVTDAGDPIITGIEIWRGQIRSAQSPLGGAYFIEFEVLAPSGKRITVTTPQNVTHTLTEEDDRGRNNAEYEYCNEDLENLNDYPTGTYVFKVYDGDTPQETVNAVFPGAGTLAFPDFWPSLTAPAPTGYAVTAPSNQKYEWSAYGGTPGSANLTLFGIGSKTTDDELVDETGDVATFVSYTATGIPRGEYRIELSHQNRSESTENGRDLRFVNEHYIAYDLTVTGAGNTFQELLETFLDNLVQENGAWTNLPGTADTADISQSETNAFRPAMVTDGTRTYVAWTQTRADMGKREIYLKYYDSAQPENGWQALDGSATGGGVSQSAETDSVAPRLVVQQNPHRLWVVWQQGQMNDMLEQIQDAVGDITFTGGVNEMLNFFKALYAVLTNSDDEDAVLQVSPTYIYAKHIDLDNRGTWAELNNSASGTGVSQADQYSWCSRPDITLTNDGYPFITWDYMRLYPDGAGVLKMRKIYNSNKTDLGNVFGACNRGAGWKTLDNLALDYTTLDGNNVRTNSITAKNKWDIAVSPRAVRGTADSQPVVAFLHTEIDQSTGYRAIPKVHVQQYSSRGAWAGIGDGDAPGGICPEPGLATNSICSQIAMAALADGKLAVTFTRSGPEMIGPQVPVPATQICGRVWDSSAWTHYDNAWNDFSASLFCFASSSAVAVNGDGNPVVAWVDAGLNVFAFEWDMTHGHWDLLGLSYWMPSDINTTTGLQGGTALGMLGGQPVVAWHSAPLTDELKALVPSLSDTEDAITNDLITGIQSALDSATFDIKVRQFMPRTTKDVIQQVFVVKGDRYVGGTGAPTPFAEVTVEVAYGYGVAAVTLTTPTAQTFDLAAWNNDGGRDATQAWEFETTSLYSAFTDGNYTVAVYDRYGETLATTTIPFMKPDGVTPLTRPNTVPSFTRPDPRRAVLDGTPSVTLQWYEWATPGLDPLTSRIGLIYYAFAEDDDGPELRTLQEDIDKEHSFVPVDALTPGPYKVRLFFADGNVNAQNADGVTFTCAKMIESRYDLMVVDPNHPGAGQVTDVQLVRLRSASDSRAGLAEFECEIHTVPNVSAVWLITPNETQIPVPYDWTEEDGSKWWELEVAGGESVLEFFGQGVYGIKVAYQPKRGALAYHTSCVFFGQDDGADLPMPSVLPEITFPARNGVAKSPFTATWTEWDPNDPARSDPSAGIFIEAWNERDDSGQELELARDATAQAFTLAPGAYELEVVFFTTREGETNRGATAWSVFNATIAERDFVVPGTSTTAAEKWADQEKQENGWKYYDLSASDAALDYLTPGADGDNDGYVRADLTQLGQYLEHYWPCYLMPPETDSVTADFTNGTVSIALNPSADLDLKNGTLRFFVGEREGARAGNVFYCTTASFALGPADTWTTRTVTLSDDANDWEAPLGDGVTPLAELLKDPPMFGFVVYGATVAPTGTLGFDSFALTGEGFTITLDPGWNLISFPLHTAQTIGQIFGRPGLKLGPLWAWDARQRKYEAPSDDTAPQALRGYWVYSFAGGVTRPVYGTPATGETELFAGWNLIGPANRCLKPVADGIGSTVWRWAAGQTQRLMIVRDTDYLEPGCAYWLYAYNDLDGFFLDFAYELKTENWTPDEIEYVDLFVQVQNMINEICGDEEIFSTTDNNDIGRGDPDGGDERTTLGPSRFKDYRALEYNVLQGRLKVTYNYTPANPRVTGDIHIWREGPLLRKYYVVDFQDNFQFMGIDIDGQIELERLGIADTLRTWELRVRDSGNRRLTFNRNKHNDGRVFKAILVVTAATIAVRSDRFEVDLPRDGASGVKGDGTWGDTCVHLGNRMFELFTRDSGSSSSPKLVFNRAYNDPSQDCICPRNGPLYFAGQFDNVRFDFTDSSNGIAGRLETKLADAAVVTAFKSPPFKFSFVQSLNATALYQFNSACGDPALNIAEVDSIRVPIYPPTGLGIMNAVGDVLSGMNTPLGNTRWHTYFRWAREFLVEKADEDGFCPIAPDHVKTRVKRRLEEILDWNQACTP